MYPTRYQLPELTAHVVAVLERRREGYSEWNAGVEAKLAEEAKAALAEAGRQFAEVADDKPYWQRLEQLVMTAALPRYFKLANAEQQLEKVKYNVWRGGDLISRAAYAAAGLVVAAIVFRTGLPKLVEPLPLAFLIGGPMIPDLQVWFARRRYASKLATLVGDMRDEAAARDLYRPMMDAAPAPIDESVSGSIASEKPKDKVGD